MQTLLNTLTPGLYSFAASQPVAKPKIGEATDAQSTRQAGMGGAAMDSLPGFGPSRKRSLELYAEIAREPTVVVTRQAIVSPIVANTWTYQRRDGVPDAVLDFIKEAIEPLRYDLVTESLKAIEYGDAPCEKIWKMDGSRVVIERIKPLRRDATESILDAKGNPIGLRNKAGDKPVDLLRFKAYHYIYERDPLFPYGRPRYVDLIDAYEKKRQILNRLAQYLAKIAGIVVQLHYPDGTSKDVNGADRPNDWIAQQILDAVSAGKSVRLPNLFAALADQNPKQAAELAGKSQWVLSVLETSSSDHSDGLLNALEYIDKLLVRGMRRPERTVLEGQHGTKADASVHTDTGVIDSELLGGDVVRTVNRQAIDDMLVLNFGEKMRGAVWAVPSPITDATAENKMAVLQALIDGATTAAAMARKIDADAVLKDLDIPITAGSEGPLEPVEPVEPKPLENAGNADTVKTMSLADDVDALDVLLQWPITQFSAASGDDGYWFTTDTGNHIHVEPGETKQQALKKAFGRNHNNHAPKPGTDRKRKSDNRVAEKNKTKEKTPSEKARRAKSSHNYTGTDRQRHAEENERVFAKSIGGASFDDSEPVDVVVPDKSGRVAHGIEMKTVTDNKHQKITMDSYSQVRKGQWERKNNAIFHTVAVVGDAADEHYFYRRGIAGSSRLSAMHEVQGMANLKKLVTSDDSKLPLAAQRTDERVTDRSWAEHRDTDGRKGFRHKKSGEIVRAKK